ncbi:YigZ family protein [Propionivibrio limicola]|uniref:YigZ family protein n=1 Tax=Propionivibrio limicola TaxID=167645 RepID=UPI001B875AEC|nr:YigZ family protein [Propionivibrio limicola]
MIPFRIPASHHSFELEEKRSRFIAYAAHAASREAAETFIRDIRSQHPQARHVCWAYIAGAPTTTVMSMSDDGEPSGTAGRPMLRVLQHSGVGEIVVAVVRYFGGIKLGTGGLQRAYSEAVSGVLEDLPVSLKVARTAFRLRFAYAQEPAVRHVLGHYDVDGACFDYGEDVSLSVQVAESEVTAFQTEVVNQCAGALEIECVED